MMNNGKKAGRVGEADTQIGNRERTKEKKGHINMCFYFKTYTRVCDALASVLFTLNVTLNVKCDGLCSQIKGSEQVEGFDTNNWRSQIDGFHRGRPSTHFSSPRYFHPLSCLCRFKEMHVSLQRLSVCYLLHFIATIATIKRPNTCGLSVTSLSI